MSAITASIAEILTLKNLYQTNFIQDIFRSLGENKQYVRRGFFFPAGGYTAKGVQRCLLGPILVFLNLKSRASKVP